ncbi:MAG: hypothetical protein CFE21_17195 [Bacteroidetes bacterium B1(2017)]|nr:MAG: hypothetical protein CFE21_17195 [Bacteroidetes bacterium B1(2017)]
MKHALTLLLLLSFDYVAAQILPGQYFTYGRKSRGEQLIFLPDNHFQLIIGEDTIGGTSTSKKGMLLAIKYRIDTTLLPHTFTSIIYDKKSGNELKTTVGLYRQIDPYTVDIILGMGGLGEAKEIDENSPDLMRLSLNCDENYINLLRLNELRPILGFKPETKEKLLANGMKEISYLQKCIPIHSSQFQSKEINEYTKEGKLTKRTLLDSANNLFVGQQGYCIKVIKYNKNQQVEVEQCYKNRTELMSFTGKVFPQVTYVYADSNLVEVKRLINTDSLKLIVASQIKFIYDSYGDQIDWEYYYTDGSKKPDTLKSNLILHIQNWIASHALYPQTYEPILFGYVKESSILSNNIKEANSEKYSIYLEFYLNDSNNVKQKFTGDFQFDYQYELDAIAYKTEHTGNSTNYSWSDRDFDDWKAIYCKAPTAEELKQKELKNKEQMEKTLSILDEALKGDNPDITISGDMDKKTLRETRRALKKAAKK